jgi:hypothetical protein
LLLKLRPRRQRTRRCARSRRSRCGGVCDPQPVRERATIAAVSRRTAARTSKLDRVRALPWVAVLQGAVVIGRRWRALSAKDRARLTGLARDSHGRLGNLSTKERAELRRLVGKLDLSGIGRELFGLARRGRRRRGRRRGIRT